MKPINPEYYFSKANREGTLFSLIYQGSPLTAYASLETVKQMADRMRLNVQYIWDGFKGTFELIQE